MYISKIIPHGAKFCNNAVYAVLFSFLKNVWYHAYFEDWISIAFPWHQPQPLIYFPWDWCRRSNIQIFIWTPRLNGVNLVYYQKGRDTNLCPLWLLEDQWTLHKDPWRPGEEGLNPLTFTEWMLKCVFSGNFTPEVSLVRIRSPLPLRKLWEIKAFFFVCFSEKKSPRKIFRGDTFYLSFFQKNVFFV